MTIRAAGVLFLTPDNKALERALSGRADMVGASTLEKLDAVVRICESMAQRWS